MLQLLRRAANSFVAKILLALLVLSFALWGIGDVFRHSGSNVLASVGSTEITPQAYRNDYDRERQYLSRRSGQVITNEQAENMGLRRSVLNQMLTEATFDEVARKNGLQVSNGLIAKEISQDNAFQSPQGKFDPAHFQQLLRSNGYSEAMYVRERAQLIKRRMLAQSMTAGLEIPKLYAESIQRLENEKRVIDYVVLTPEKFAPVEQPSEDTIKAYYNEVKNDYMVGEKRVVKTYTLSPTQLATTLAISDEDAQKVYQRTQDKYGKPEKRQIEQINFADAASAATFADAVKKTATLALPNGATRSDLGLVLRDQLVDVAVRDEAFALPANGYSGVVASSFGPVVLHILKIEPATVTPFDEVKAAIKKELALAHARETILDMHDKIENERASGATLDEIAATLKLDLVTQPAIDRDGKDETGKPVTALSNDVVVSAFAADQGSDNEPVQTQADKGWVWYEVAKIEPEHERGFDDVRGDVVKQWVNEQQRIKLSELAKNMIADLQGGKRLTEIAADKALPFVTSPPFKRDGKLDDLSPSALDASFKVGKAQAGTGLGANPLNRVVFVVKSIEVPAPTKLEAKLADNVTQALNDDLLFEFIDSAQKTLGVSVNQKMLDQMSSGTGL